MGSDKRFLDVGKLLDLADQDVGHDVGGRMLDQTKQPRDHLIRVK
jgi:hypothetical protein